MHPPYTSDLPAYAVFLVRNLPHDLETNGSRQPNNLHIIPDHLNPPTALHHGCPDNKPLEVVNKSEPGQCHSRVEQGAFEVINVTCRLNCFANNSQHQSRSSTTVHRYSDRRSDPKSQLNAIDYTTQTMIDSQIARWATGIPENLPLSLSGLAASSPGIVDTVPNPADYPLIAFLAIFGSPGRRLTNKGLIDALMEWFRRYSGIKHWELGVANCISNDSRFKYVFGSNELWTVNISAVYRHPFIHREAGERPRLVLPPPSSFPGNKPNLMPQPIIDKGVMKHTHPVAKSLESTTSSNARPDLEPRFEVISLDEWPGTSTISFSFDPSHNTIPPVYGLRPSRRGWKVLCVLPSFSELLHGTKAPQAHESHVGADSVFVVLPSIREILGHEMDLVQNELKSNKP